MIKEFPLKDYVIEAMKSKAISTEYSKKFVVVWSNSVCRAYSCDTPNFHFSVRSLDKFHMDYSLPLDISL